MIVELENQFRLFSDRWKIHRAHVLALTDDVKKIDTTSQKIIRDFDSAKSLLDENPLKKIAEGDQVIDVDVQNDDE